MQPTPTSNNPNPKQAFGDKKPPLALLPLIAHIHGAMAFYDGAGKYGKYNWRTNPVEADTYVQAMIRHARLWENGEDFARDTKVHNLGGVIACAALLLDAEANGCLIDNRVKSQVACDLLHDAEKLMESLKAQHLARRIATAADQQDADSDRQRIEGNKRAQAAEALALYGDLVRRAGTTSGDRIGAAADVILNMVNGVFPEDPTPVIWPDPPSPDDDPDDTEGGNGI